MNFKRILLKLSGEALKNNKDGIIDFDYVKEICQKIKNLYSLNYEILIVIGGGNIWRGRDNTYIDSTSSDKIGLLSTSMNSLILESIFKELNINSIALNSFDIDNIIIKSTKKIISNNLQNKNIIIFGGGTGKTGCSTDTAAALRAIETEADILIKLTNVDGVYEKNPKEYKNVKKYKNISYKEVIEKNLNFMDKESIILCKNNEMPILVLSIDELANLDKILKDFDKGTLIK